MKRASPDVFIQRSMFPIFSKAPFIKSISSVFYTNVAVEIPQGRVMAVAGNIHGLHVPLEIGTSFDFLDSTLTNTAIKDIYSLKFHVNSTAGHLAVKSRKVQEY